MELVHGVLIEFAQNVIFRVNNSSSRHSNNYENNFFALSEGQLMILTTVLVNQEV